MSEEEPEHWQEAREWAERNDFNVFEDYPRDGTLAVKIGEQKYVLLGEFEEQVNLMKLRNLGRAGSTIQFHDKQMTVTHEGGRQAHVSEVKFPL